MPDNSGVYTRPLAWEAEKAANNDITASTFDSHDNDLKDALNNRLFRDGTNSPTADLPMAGRKHTNVANAALRNQYAALGQIQDQAGVYFVDSGAANAYVITPAPAITAYSAGQRFVFRAGNANTGNSTINVSGLGTRELRRDGGANQLSSGDIQANGLYEIIYDGSNFQMVAPSIVNSSNAWQQQQYFPYKTETAGTVSWNLNEKPKLRISLTANTTINAPTNMVDGGEYALELIQDATGGRTVTFSGGVWDWSKDSPPSLPSAANSVAILRFDSNGTKMRGILGHISNIS